MTKTLPMLALAITLTAATAQAGPISGARIVKNGGAYGSLYLKVNGKERKIDDFVSRVAVIENGNAAIFASDGGSKMDFHSDFLWRYDTEGNTNLLMGRFTGISSFETARGRSGKVALIVKGESDGTGAPTAAVVHPQRGVVWKQYNSRVVAVRNGRAAIAVYKSEAGNNPGDRPIRFLYPDLDTLLKRPTLQMEE